MAINRILNAIWAEISARGSLIKTATTQYIPSPGTLTVNSAPNGANNQAVYAVTSGSPFTPVDPDGLAVVPDGGTSPLAVSAGLGDGLTANMPSLDENSGKYQVLRQYGDIYMYNDGNIIMWGGNGKNFNFGNSYEEVHAWAVQACVYNGETFTIPQGAMSLFLAGNLSQPANFNGPASVDAYEWLGGTVSKSWGNEYNYAYGRAYEWNGGPNNYVDAYGNSGAALTDVMQGKHCTFSYGTGYEESLVTWNNNAWFHADDTNSPYAGRKHDSWQSEYLSLETVAASFSASPSSQTSGGLLGAIGGPLLEAAVDQSTNPTDFANRNTWAAANLLVSKTFGNVYDYSNGFALSVQEGPAEDRVYGNSYSTVVGNSVESVTGNSTSTVTGNSNETVTGNSTAMIQGNSTEQYWGGQAAFFMGGQSSMALAACDEINLAAVVSIVGGAATEVYLGAKLSTALGALMEFKLATSLSVTLGPNIEFNLTKVEVNTAAKVDTEDVGCNTAFLKLFV